MSGIDAPIGSEVELPADDLPWKPEAPAAPAADTQAPVDMRSLSLEQIGKIGRVLYASGYFSDLKGEAQAITKVLAGYEIGITPFQALTGFHVIQGKPTMGAGLIGAQVKKSGRYDYKPVETTAERCRIEWYQLIAGRWELQGESAFTMEDAKRAKLTGKSTWQAYPVDMCFARALSAGARRYCPDVFGGAIYVAEELGGQAPADDGITFGVEGGAG